MINILLNNLFKKSSLNTHIIRSFKGPDLSLKCLNKVIPASRKECYNNRTPSGSVQQK